MLAKVFISHQQRDSSRALEIADRLRSVHNIASYLDVVDTRLNQSGDDLGAHIRVELGKCTHLLAVVSDATPASWWVPWEIGVATEKDYPLATYAVSAQLLPEYLKKWPYLRSLLDLDKYAAATKTSIVERATLESNASTTFALHQSTRDFHLKLRRALGQV